MKLYRTRKGNLLEAAGKYFLIEQPWDELINREDLHSYLQAISRRINGYGSGKKSDNSGNRSGGDPVQNNEVPSGLATVWCEKETLSPAVSQEIWAAGVTYLRSRDARMEESKESGGADFYDKVYEAERPELFFKSLPHRVAAHGEKVYIRRDSTWNVPEPELTLFMNSKGSIQAYTIGNDMSSRSIEGENPLYLPQAKMYERSAAIGPCLYVPEQPIPSHTSIHMTIFRGGDQVFSGTVQISQMKRSLTELAGWLFREFDFGSGCFLMTGTCLVPPNEFTLQEGDQVDIRIDGIGVLTNTVAYKPL